MNLAHLNLFQIVILIAALAVVWIILRAVLRLAARALATGCAIIFLFGLALVLYHVIR